MKRLLSLCVAVCLLLCCVPLTVSAATSGSCGSNVTWSFNSGSGKLTVSGSGAMDTSTTEWAWAEYAEDITSVTVSSGVTAVGPYAFAYLPNLKTVSLPSSLDYLFEGAFEGCESLKTVTLPEGLLALDSYVFYGCTALESIKLPKSLEFVGYGTFGYCAALTKFTVASGSQYFSTDSSGVLFDKGKTILVAAPGGMTGGYSVPGGVMAVYPYAFCGCVGVTGVFLPASITEYYPLTFEGCEALENIWVSESNTKFASDSNGLLYNKAKTELWQIPNGKSGTVKIADTARKIMEGAAYGCYNLTGVTIPEGVSTIEAYAFSQCVSLKELVLPSTLYKSYEYAFSACISLEKVDFSGADTGISEGMFYQCLALSEVSGTENIDELASHAFEYCISLEEFPFPKRYFGMGDYVFANCISLKEVEIYNASVRMGEYVFSDCISLERVDLSNLHTVINEGVFMNCSSLKEVLLPENVGSIGAHAFENCVSLERIVANASCFEEYAFHNCANLKELISDSAGYLEIGDYAFGNCGDDLTVYIPCVYQSIRDNAFAGTTATFYYRSTDFYNFEWSENSQIDYGGDVTWVAYDPGCKDHVHFNNYYVNGWECWTCRDCGYTRIMDYLGYAAVELYRDYQHKTVKVDIRGNNYKPESLTIFRALPTVSDPAKFPVVNVKLANNKQPLTVIIPLETVTKGAVAYKVEEDGSYTMLNKAQVTDAGVQLFVEENCSIVVADKSIQTFKDTAGYWSTNEMEDALDYLTSRGIIAGKSATSYAPAESIQRRTVALVLWRMAGSPKVPLDTQLTDTENLGNTYLMAVCWAEDAGIITGYSDNTFRGEQELERRHFALMLHRFVNYMNVDLGGTTTKDLSEFEDHEGIGSSAWRACQWAVNNGIINGRSADTFDPNGTTTRGQMAIILYRFLQKYYAAQ